MGRCPELNETFPFMLPGWAAEKVGDSFEMISPRVAAERRRAENLAGGVTVRVTPSAVAGAASLADAGVASPADLAGVVTIGVASLADAGAASLADAGVASLADLAGSVAGGTMNLNMPICARTEEVTLVQKCPGRDRSVMHGSVTGESDVDPRFVTILFGNVLAMWAATQIVWTKPYRKVVTSTHLGRYYLSHFVLLRMI